MRCLLDWLKNLRFVVGAVGNLLTHRSEDVPLTTVPFLQYTHIHTVRSRVSQERKSRGRARSAHAKRQIKAAGELQELQRLKRKEQSW